MAVKTKKTDLQRLNGKLKQVIDPAVAKALSHPLRSHILVTLGHRVASPNEIARELGLAARDLDYHVKVLVEVGMIQLVRREKRRGVKEHFYELSSQLLHMDDPEWEDVPEAIRGSFAASLLKVVMDEAMEALRAGTFNTRHSHHSRVPMLLDEQGWHELTGVMGGALDQIMAVRQASDMRRRQGAETRIPVEVYLLGFERAGGSPGPDVAARA